jgi:hypothetical protein
VAAARVGLLAGRIMNRAQPVGPQQKARQDAAWSRLADAVQAPGHRKGQ